MTYYMFQSGTQWRWHLEAANGKKIAESGESYHNKQDCLGAINLVKGSASAPVKER
jgi:uncharacterized protein YegP (UPF0339 family)